MQEVGVIFLFLLFCFFILLVVSGVLGMQKCLRKEIVIFDTKKDLAVSAICSAVFTVCFVTAFYISMYLFFIPLILLVCVLLYVPAHNIIQSFKFGRTAWDRWLIFSARSALSLLSMFIVMKLLSPPRSYHDSKGQYHYVGIGEQVIHMAFWAAIAVWFYNWVMRFVREEQRGDVIVLPSLN